MKTLTKKDTFNSFENEVNYINSTNVDYYVGSDDRLLFTQFAEEGLASAGSKLSFPARFLVDLRENGHEDLCQNIFDAKYQDYFRKAKDDTKLLVRDFLGESYALLSDKYSIFDDHEIVDLLKTSDLLMHSEEYWGYVTPERLHLRFVSPKKVYIGDDSSPLSACVFVDNSMTGKSSFRIRFGLYRWACTNGIISGLKEFDLIKEIHLGQKDYVSTLSDVLSNLEDYENTLIDLVEKYQNEPSTIAKFGKDIDSVVSYLKLKLNTNNKIATKIYETYLIYGGNTKWDLTNAITDVAHDLNIADRISFESKALKVA